MKNDVKFLLLIVFFAAGSLQAQGQSVNKAISNGPEMKRILGNIIETSIVPELLSSFSDNERRLAETVRINIIVDRTSREMGANRNKEIILHTGYFELLFLLIDANLSAAAFNKLELLDEYIIYLSQCINSTKKFAVTEKIKRFSEFANINKGQATAFASTAQYDNHFKKTLANQLFIVLAHEYAHIIYDHFGQIQQYVKLNKDSGLEDYVRKLEDEADKFAIAKNVKIKNLLLFTTPYLLVLMMQEKSFIPDSHSPTPCRLEKYLSAALLQLKDKELLNRLEVENPYIKAEIEQLTKARNMVKSKCIAEGVFIE